MLKPLIPAIKSGDRPEVSPTRDIVNTCALSCGQAVPGGLSPAVCHLRQALKAAASKVRRRDASHEEDVFVPSYIKFLTRMYG
jgi:hypothetical protein